MKKILITSKMLNIGEVGSTLIALLNNLDYTKYSVDLMLLDAGILINKVPKDVNVIYYQDYLLMPSRLFHELKSKMMVQSLYDSYCFALKKIYDIAIAYDGDDNYMDMIAGSVKASKKVIWVHDLPSKLSIKKYDYFDNIICSTPSLMKSFNLLYSKYKNKVNYIFDYIDGDSIIKLSHESTSLKLDRGFNMVTVCNLDNITNLNNLLIATKNLVDSNHNVKLYIIGNGKKISTVSNKIFKLGLSSNVMILGTIPNYYNIISKCDLFINVDNDNRFNKILIASVILDVPFVSINTMGTKNVLDIVPLNGGILSSNISLEDSIKKIMKGWQKHIPFDYKKYNNDINNAVKELLDK